MTRTDPTPDTGSRGWSRRGFLQTALAGSAAVTAASLAGPRRLLPAARAATTDQLQPVVDLRFGMFNHFNLGTFTGEEWATPHQDPTIFAPTDVDCDQWAAAAKSAGMTFGVLTTKHHDGFSLWPTRYGTQNVAYSGWTGDVVKAYTDAFRGAGLRVGLYFSVWDRTHPVEAYGGYHVTDPTKEITPENVEYVEGQVRELLSNYGTIDLFVTDGYAWQAGQRRISYQRLRDIVKSLQPDCLMVDHGALSVPWLGDAIYFEEPLGYPAPAGNTYAGLQGQTISNGWFWHSWTPQQDPMSKDDIVTHLTDTQERYVTFLLNCPPNQNGVLDDNIVNRLAEVGPAWTRNTTRGALPAQPLRPEWPVTPTVAHASAWHDGEGAMRAIDGYSDGQNQTCWSTWSQDGSLTLPQTFVVDLGGVWSDVSTLEYLPKQWGRNESTDGDITAATVSVSTDGDTWTDVGDVSWAADRTVKLLEWSNRDVRFVRIEVTAGSGDYANISDVHIGGRSAKPTLVSRGVPTGSPYRLVNRASNLVLDVYDYGTADGTNIQQYTWTGAPCQQFTFTDVGDGFFTLRDRNSGNLAQIADLSRDEDGDVVLWHDVDAWQQQWAVTPVGSGFVTLTNRFSGLAMAGVEDSTAPGADVREYTYDGSARFQWQLVAV